MSEKIEVGDLVMIVHGLKCCGGGKSFGLTFTVTELENEAGLRCKYCKTVTDLVLANPGGFAIERLKRINPPPISQSIETREERPVNIFSEA